MANIMVPVIAGVLINQDNKYLLVQEAKAKTYQLWNFPAGHVEIGESIEGAAVREAKEETGYDVKLLKKISIYQKLADDVVIHTFEAKIVGGNLNLPPNEILDAKWFSFDEIKNMTDQLRKSEWILETIKNFQKSPSCLPAEVEGQRGI